MGIDFDNTKELSIQGNELCKLTIAGKLVWHKAMEFVDLGCRDSNGNKILWSTYNLYANSPYEAGGHLAWGELGNETDYTDGEKSSYTKDNYKWYDAETDSVTLTTELSGADKDAATFLLGEGYKTPSKDEWALIADTENFTWTWDSDKNGVLVTSKISGFEGKSIFIFGNGASEISENKDVFLWLRDSNGYRVHTWKGYDGGDYTSTSNKWMGRGIRPIKVEEPDAKAYYLVDSEGYELLDSDGNNLIIVN